MATCLARNSFLECHDIEGRDLLASLPIDGLSWLEISIVGYHSDSAAGPRLRLHCSDHTVAEVGLARDRTGGVHAIVGVEGLVPRQVVLLPAEGASGYAVRHLRLHRLSAFDVLMRAVREAPWQALKIVGHRLAGRRVRARNRLAWLLGIKSATAYAPTRSAVGGCAAPAVCEAIGEPTTRQDGPLAPRLRPDPTRLPLTSLTDLTIAVFSHPTTQVRAHARRGNPDRSGPATLSHLLDVGFSPNQIILVTPEKDPRLPSPNAPREQPYLQSTQSISGLLSASSRPWLLCLSLGESLAVTPEHLRQRAEQCHWADIVYADHDVLSDGPHCDRKGADSLARPERFRTSPAYKPDWNRELFWAQDYLGPILVRRCLIEEAYANVAQIDRSDTDETGEARSHIEHGRSCSSAAPDILSTDILSPDIPSPDIHSDLYSNLRTQLLAAGPAAGRRIAHVPEVMFHRDASAAHRQASRAAAACWRDLISRHLALSGDAASVSLDAFANVRVTSPLPNPEPLVSVIVPTRDRVDLLLPCIEGVLHRTAYSDIEVIIADNDSSEPAVLDYFEAVVADRRVTVLPCPGAFNFAAINNAAVEAARGDVIAFLNNDIEVKGEEWLREMVGWALRDEIGAVGARLLYANGRVQHAGVTLGINGLAGHAHRFLEATHPGYMRRLQCHQRVSAVTAACLVVEKRKFDSVGGFDSENFAVAYNDVDLCLRLAEAGFSTIYTPYAELFHKETASRPLDFSRERLSAYERESACLQKRWGHLLARDPFYNPNLSGSKEDFSFSRKPGGSGSSTWQS